MAPVHDFRMVDRAEVFPRACLCGETIAGPFVDTLMDDVHGQRAYFCARCQVKFAAVFDLVPAAKFAAVAEAEAAEAKRAAELERKLEDAHRQIAAHAQKVVDAEADATIWRGKFAAREDAITNLEAEVKALRNGTHVNAREHATAAVQAVAKSKKAKR